MANLINSYNSIMDKYGSIMSNGINNSNETDTKSAAASFENVLSSKISELNDKQVQADNLIQDFAAGNVDDLHKVMIASQEAMLSMEMAVQIRNKAVEAYKELNNMQL